jgi:hypothetical protein
MFWSIGTITAARRPQRAISSTPAGDFITSIRQRVLCILKGKNRRPCQLVKAKFYPLKDGKHCRSFLPDAILRLIIEGAVETVQIKIQ